MLGGYLGWYTGWVIRVGIPGGYWEGVPSPPTCCCEEHPPTSDRRERAHPAGWVGRKQGAGITGLGTAAGTAPGTTLRARSAPCRGLPVPGPCRDPPGRDLTSFPVKLVKTAKCHRKVSIRPVIVPNLKNGSIKSPLDFLRFPLYAAFSHKELMGRFDASRVHYCQNDEVSTDVHTRGRVAHTPTDTAASCSWCPLLMCSARDRPGKPHRILVLLGN